MTDKRRVFKGGKVQEIEPKKETPKKKRHSD